MPPRVQAASSLRRAQRAVTDLLRALGVPLVGELARAPARAARLWREHLLAGEGIDAKAVLGRGAPSRARGAVTLRGIHVHLVCPHHLTVAFGEAQLAYLPAGRIAGFGALTRLVRACTARVVMQEDATQCIADTLAEVLGARAAVAMIDARHPCHAVSQPSSHRARAVTWAEAGNPKDAATLHHLLERTP